MRINLDIKSIWVCILCVLSSQLEIYVIVMSSMLLHEIGHIVMGLMLKMKLKKIEILMIGFTMEFKLKAKDYMRKIGRGNMLILKKMIICIAGPAVNMAIVVSAMFFEYGKYVESIVYSNMILMMFNMLPIYPLDGGRIIKYIVHMIRGKNSANEITRRISYLTALLITVIMLCVIIYNQNVSILLSVLMLWIIVTKEEKRYKQTKKIQMLIEKYGKQLEKIV